MRRSLLSAALVSVFLCTSDLAAGPINVLFDCSHWYKFTNVSTRNYQKYAWSGEEIYSYSSLCTIHGNDVENINVIVVYLDDNLPYVPEDGPFLKTFVESGGGVWLVANGTLGKNPRHARNPRTRDAMTKHLGITFTSDSFNVGKGQTLPIRDSQLKLRSENGFKANGVKAEKDWTVMMQNAGGKPLMLTRSLGKGRVVATTFNPFNLRFADKSRNKADFANAEILKLSVQNLGANRTVTKPKDYKPCGLAASPGYQGERIKNHGSITTYSSEYLQPQVDTMVKSWKTKVKPVLEDMTGYTFDGWLKRRGMDEGVNFLLLPVAGSGFAGNQVGLGVMKPNSETDLSAYYGILGHECFHFLDAPYSEPLNEESMAIYGGTSAERTLGSDDKLTPRLTKAYAHPKIFEYDPVRHRSGAAAKPYAGDKTLTFGKYLIVMDQLTKAFGGESVRRNYYQLKKFLLPYPKQGDKWGPHTSAYLWSIACSADLEPFFRAFNMQIDWNSLEHAELRKLPFDMEAVARQVGIPQDSWVAPRKTSVDDVIASLLTAIGREK